MFLFKVALKRLTQKIFFSRDNSQSREEALSVLRSSGEFVRYALSVVVQKIQQLEDTGQTDGPDGQQLDKTFRFLCDITRFSIPASFAAFGLPLLTELFQYLKVMQNNLISNY